MQKSTFDFENKLINEGYEFVIGIDEAGRGPLAGPVVACAVATQNNLRKIISGDKKWDLVRDSKKLSEKQREKIFDFIHENFYVGIGICNHKTIDRINILEASFLAMKKAVTDLTKKINIGKKSRCIVLVDGNKKIPNFSGIQMAIVGGDKFVKSISAASVIAKVTRDHIMLKMQEEFPKYGFARHKGYGTKKHIECLQKFGPCEIHRRSFEPVKSLVKRGQRW